MPSTVYVPRPVIAIAGQANEQLAANVLTVLVEETTDGLYRCEARFYNYGVRSGGTGYLFFGRDVLDFGKDFAVTIGPEETSRTIFQGRISGLEAEYPQAGGGEVLVLAEDRLQSLRLKRRTRVFEDVSDEDVIRQIASEHSLTPKLDVSGPTHKVLAQVNQSDLAFIRARARSINAEVWVEGDTLHATSRTDRDAGTVALEYGLGLLSFSVRADLADQVTEIGVAGWDVAAKAAIEETADESAISAELQGDTSGSDVLRAAFGERKERIVHQVPLSTQEARAQAQAAYRERARRFVTGSGVADGDPRIRVGGMVTLSDLGGLFDGAYSVVRVRHTYDMVYGFRTEFDVERAGLGQAQ